MLPITEKTSAQNTNTVVTATARHPNRFKSLRHSKGRLKHFQTTFLFKGLKHLRSLNTVKKEKMTAWTNN